MIAASTPRRSAPFSLEPALIHHLEAELIGGAEHTVGQDPRGDVDEQGLGVLVDFEVGAEIRSWAALRTIERLGSPRVSAAVLRSQLDDVATFGRGLKRERHPVGIGSLSRSRSGAEAGPWIGAALRVDVGGVLRDGDLLGRPLVIQSVGRIVTWTSRPSKPASPSTPCQEGVCQTRRRVEAELPADLLAFEEPKRLQVE